MNILYLSWWLPYPLRTGSCVTNYNTIKQLAANHEVSLVSFIDSEDELQYVPEMTKWCTDVTCVLREPKSMVPLKRALGLLSPAPRSILLARSREMRDAVVHKLEQKRFDCAIADGTTTLEYALDAEGFPKVLFHHNVDSVVMKRAHETQTSRAKRFRRWLTWRKAALVERHVSQPAEVSVNLKDGKAATVKRTVLTHDRLNAHNTFDNPHEVVPQTDTLEARGTAIRCTLPPASVTRLDVQLA